MASLGRIARACFCFICVVHFPICLRRLMKFSEALVRFGEVTDFLEKIKFGDLKDEGYLKVATPEMDFVIEAASNENYVSH